MGQARVLLAVALGGAVGALGRYAATLVFPTATGSLAWTVLLVNVTGCALLGVLTGLIATDRLRHPLARPFLGIGVLGGFTTFSTFALDTRSQADAGDLPGALAYVGLTVVACLAAALVGVRSVGQR